VERWEGKGERSCVRVGHEKGKEVWEGGGEERRWEGLQVNEARRGDGNQVRSGMWGGIGDDGREEGGGGGRGYQEGRGGHEGEGYGWRGRG